MNIRAKQVIFQVFLLSLIFCAHAFSADLPFYRIIDGPNPGPEQATLDRLLYGTDVLYTGDAVNPPVQIKGTVWHANLEESKYFIGTSNPVLEGKTLLEKIENNKWEEAKILMETVPEWFPKTENMAEVLKELNMALNPNQPHPSLCALAARLKKRYPQGFFLKPIEGFNASGTFPTEQTAFGVVYEGYIQNLKPKAVDILETTGDPDEVHYALKSAKHYEGRILEQLFKDPKSVIIQERVKPALGSSVLTPNGTFKPLVEEYRVHIVEGQALAGATQNRWEDYHVYSQKNILAVEWFAQKVMDRLSPSLRKMCFGMDILRTENGLFKVIELNPGGQSAYLYPETDLWDTHMLAARYLGKPTELMQEVFNLETATNLTDKQKILSRILNRLEIQNLQGEVDHPLSEILMRAKNAFMEELYKNPTATSVLEIAYALKQFKLQSFLTQAESKFFGNQIESFQPETTGTFLSLLELRMLNLPYNDLIVAKKISETIQKKIKAQTVNVGDEPSVRRIVREAIKKQIFTQKDILKNPPLLNEICQKSNSFESTPNSRYYYRGSVRNLYKVLLKEFIRSWHP